jgi:hypothetical protein
MTDHAPPRIYPYSTTELKLMPSATALSRLRALATAEALEGPQDQVVELLGTISKLRQEILNSKAEPVQDSREFTRETGVGIVEWLADWRAEKIPHTRGNYRLAYWAGLLEYAPAAPAPKTCCGKCHSKGTP